MANFTALNLGFNCTPPPVAAIARWHGSSAAAAAHRRNHFDRPGLAVGRRGTGVVAMAVGSGAGGKYKGTLMREKQLTEMIEEKVKEAKQVCGQDESSDECKVAWDEVEEVSQAKADLRLKLEVMHQDPLESFCQDNPETDECRLYED